MNEYQNGAGPPSPDATEARRISGAGPQRPQPSPHLDAAEVWLPEEPTPNELIAGLGERERVRLADLLRRLPVSVEA